MSHTEFNYLQQRDQLDAAVDQLERGNVLSVDTEFTRADTFYPKIGLLQISDGKQVYVIDPLTMDAREPLLALFSPDASEARRDIVLHASSEDLEVFQNWLGRLPARHWDTQIGAAFLGMGMQVGYAKLVEMVLGINLPKHETRSDWQARPLSASQLEYAAMDVEHLSAVFDHIYGKLRQQGREQWWQEECEQQQHTALSVVAPQDYYRLVANAWQLKPASQALLRQLAEWRECLARERDIPRGFIVKDNALFAIAKHWPTSMKQLSRIRDVHGKTLRRYGSMILDQIDLVDPVEAEAFDELVPLPLPRAAGKLIRQMKAIVEERANAIALPPELLGRRKLLQSLLQSYIDSMQSSDEEWQLPEALLGWRYPLVAEPLVQCIQSHHDALQTWLEQEKRTSI